MSFAVEIQHSSIGMSDHFFGGLNQHCVAKDFNLAFGEDDGRLGVVPRIGKDRYPIPQSVISLTRYPLPRKCGNSCGNTGNSIKPNASTRRILMVFLP